jgi:hypothetical protein
MPARGTAKLIVVRPLVRFRRITSFTPNYLAKRDFSQSEDIQILACNRLQGTPQHPGFCSRLNAPGYGASGRRLRPRFLDRHDNEYATKFIDAPSEVQRVRFQHVHRMAPMTFTF